MTEQLLSWGRFPRVSAASVRDVVWRDEPLPRKPGELVLAYGLGRSYGDSCLNAGGVLLRTRALDHLISFDQANGVLECEAGVTLEQILDLAVPRGWFLPVTPGTKFVTVGGAIANDVHGKNHHRDGTFGNHVLRLELHRSDGDLITCSPDDNPGLFSATIGGLGLTGLITTAQLQLLPITSPFLETERVPFRSLDEFFVISQRSEKTHAYTVAWIDTVVRGRAIGRGIFMRGNQAPAPPARKMRPSRPPRLSVPMDAPGYLLNPWSVSLFNALYERLQRRRRGPLLEHYEEFFYPLDGIADWNRLYGRRGFFQYQCVVPLGERDAVNHILEVVARADQTPFLSVLKVFGQVPSRGLMSFARPGTTLALDFPNRGGRTLDLLDRLDQIVMAAGGALYPAKDARMSSEVFRRSFPQWQRFVELIDPGFSSSFWRRVNA